MCNSWSPETAVSHDHSKLQVLSTIKLFSHQFFTLDGLLAWLISAWWCYLRHSLLQLCSEKHVEASRLLTARGGVRQWRWRWEQEAYYPHCGCSAAGKFTRQKSADEADGAGAGREERWEEKRKDGEKMRPGGLFKDKTPEVNKQRETHDMRKLLMSLYCVQYLKVSVFHIYYQSIKMSTGPL